MDTRAPSSREKIYRACQSQLGSCYCGIVQQGPCYQPPARPLPDRTSLADWSLCIAVIGCLLLPLGPIAWLMARRALRGRSRPYPRGYGQAVAAAVMGRVETFLSLYIAVIVIINRGR
jgi:hypothetical protein